MYTKCNMVRTYYTVYSLHIQHSVCTKLKLTMPLRTHYTYIQEVNDLYKANNIFVWKVDMTPQLKSATISNEKWIHIYCTLQRTVLTNKRYYMCVTHGRQKNRYPIQLILISHTSVYGMPSQNGCRQRAAALWWCLISASRSREMGSLRARHWCINLYPAGTGPVLVDQLWASGSWSRMIPFSHAM